MGLRVRVCLGICMAVWLMQAVDIGHSPSLGELWVGLGKCSYLFIHRAGWGV